MRIRLPLTVSLLAALMASASTLPAQTQSPPPDNYKQVSDLVELPEFIAGLGVLWVDPATLPVGPFLAYHKDGRLVSTIYMVPLAKLSAREGWERLRVARGASVDHVAIQFNAGHPGVAEPHYHVILWHVSPDRAARLANQ